MDIVRTTASTDIDLYKEIMQRFLPATTAFKCGNIQAGVVAINEMQAAYGLIPASRFIKLKGKQAHLTFTDKFDVLRKKLVMFPESKGRKPDENFLQYGDFQKLDDEFDALYAEFLEIKAETGCGF